MPLPSEPVTLTPEQIADLNQKLSTLRHDINGDLSLIVASTELMKLNPASTPRMLNTLGEQPNKIRNRLEKFSEELEKLVGISRNQAS